MDPEMARPVAATSETGQFGRKLKFGDILDQADDSEFLPLPLNDIAVLVSTWIRLVNDNEPPRVEQEATGDQLLALRARLMAGLVPHADFSVWRPHGARMLRQLKFHAHHPPPGGGWSTREIAGPTSYEDWKGCWDALCICDGSPAGRLACQTGLVCNAHSQTGNDPPGVLVDNCAGRHQVQIRTSRACAPTGCPGTFRR